MQPKQNIDFVEEEVEDLNISFANGLAERWTLRQGDTWGYTAEEPLAIWIELIERKGVSTAERIIIYLRSLSFITTKKRLHRFAIVKAPVVPQVTLPVDIPLPEVVVG